MRSKILLFFIALSFLVRPTESLAQVNVQDSLALVDYYNSTDGTNWFFVHWDLNAPVSQWDGIQVENNRVTGIELRGASRSGRIPSSFGNLTALTSIYLLDCTLTEAALPESFSNLINLRSLKMSAVFWHLPFPKAITKLPQLTYIDFEDNYFTDSIPSSIGDMTQLKFLNLSNCFTVNGSTIPPELGNLKNLQNLILNTNNLLDTIPNSFANLDSLQTLVLADNKLEGNIPPALNNLKKLNSILLQNNRFTFSAIEPFIQAANAISKTYGDLILSPQAIIRINRRHEKLFVLPGGTLANNTFKWYKVNTGLAATIAGDSTYTPADMGSYYATVTNSIATDLTLYSDTFNYNFFVADTTTTITQNITGTDTTYINDGIFKLASLKPVEGANALTGNVSTTVTIDPVVSTFNGQPYVQRHFDITPTVNATNSEAIVTLYFTQQDFDNFNNYVTANNLSLPLLPSGGVNNGNMRITQLHGSFTGSPDPENYNSTGSKLITPNVAWNPINKWWVVTFYVNGFSGFFISTANVALPLSLLKFNGILHERHVILQWVTDNELGTKEFIIERGNDGKIFDDIGAITANSAIGRNHYNFEDIHPIRGSNFYRLRMIDVDSRFSYSPVIKINFQETLSRLNVYPNPATSTLNIKFTVNKAERVALEITDASGKSIQKISVSVNAGTTTTPLNIENLPKGIYYLHARLNSSTEKISFIKK